MKKILLILFFINFINVILAQDSGMFVEERLQNTFSTIEAINNTNNITPQNNIITGDIEIIESISNSQNNLNSNIASIIFDIDMSFLSTIIIPASIKNDMEYMQYSQNDLSYNNEIQPINNVLSNDELNLLFEFELKKKYPKACDYINTKDYFWLSYMEILISEALKKPLKEREPYYWEIENYLNGKFVNYRDFHKQINK